jgi:phosphoribosylaminoimidazole (AIR) synthetase
VCIYREEELLAERTGNTNNSSGSDPSSALHANGLSTDKPHGAHRKQLTAKELEEAAAKEAALIAADKVYTKAIANTLSCMRAACIGTHCVYTIL